MTIVTMSNWKYFYSVQHSQIMYRLFRKKYAVPIGHGNSFLVMDKSWKIIVEKEWSPCI